VKAEEAKAGVIDRVAAIARDRARPEADDLESFVRRYYANAPPDDLTEVDPVDLYGAAIAHWSLAARRKPEGANVRVYNPQFDRDGWQTTHTVVETITDDMPFLVDSVRMALSRNGLGIYTVVHPVIPVRRDREGALLGVAATADEDAIRESFIHIEVDRQGDRALLEELAADLRAVFDDVRAAVEDWRPMLDELRSVVKALEENPPPIDSEELAEASAFLAWLGDNHFTFLGYRSYDLVREDGEDALIPVAGSGLGILREESDDTISQSFAKAPPEVRRLARQPNPLNLTKANSVSTVHRPAYLDYVGIKRFGPDGEVIGEWRFLGLYTSIVYNTDPGRIPLLRRKVSMVIERAGFPSNSHDGKDLLAILETLPRDELIQMEPEELYQTVMGILHLQERHQVRLFIRRDRFGRFFSALLYLPRERYNTDTRLAAQRIMMESLRGVSIDYEARVSESVLARLHFVIRIVPGESVDYDVADIEKRIEEAVRSWVDDLGQALVEQLGEDRGLSLADKYREAFPPGYRADFLPRVAVADIRRLEELDPAEDLGMKLRRPLEAEVGLFRLKLYRSGSPIVVSDVLPLLEHMGARVVEQHPYEIEPRGGGPPLWIYDFDLQCGDVALLDTGLVAELFQTALARVWRGEMEDDGFNRLVLRGRIPWNDVAVLRAYAKYLRQTAVTFSQEYMETTLGAHPHIAARLVELFHARFDPAITDRDVVPELAAQVTVNIDDVVSLDQDRILRSFLNLIMATLRTNAFQTTGDGEPKQHLSFKLDPTQIPELPLPRSRFEIFVYSPRTEGVHLRGGKVARGGIRWSDRREDFRTEILGLMKAQMVKNVVIVPVGAKGGFVVKRPPVTTREAMAAEVVACYRTFISGLLDLTDNRQGDNVLPPVDVVRYDDDDPYLVVAADKGTATFSDVANSISMEHGFWLGDAFASGGSAGYDHKEMGITARGAWESVKRHFRNLGTDVQSTEITVIGIGDMSGDVFGNGMLLSRHMKLLGAFNHLHVFLDPNPDPEASYLERERLFGLPRSTWADYDLELVSKGGGVWPRTAKSIPLSHEIRQMLKVDAEQMTPNELIRAMLAAPVDLLWNGGIGTYVKASTETQADVGDKANDTVRIDAAELRARVVGEGGNLGFTQLARVEYARLGGRINTDAIDNSAGVDCSDHEVNIKILLDAVVADGDLTGKQRNTLLEEMTDDVAHLVLRDNYRQTQALSNAAAQALPMVDVHVRYMRWLEQAGRLDRDLEGLPSDEALAERKAAGEGLTSPEFAVLLAYTKIELYEELLASGVAEDPYLSSELGRYFPEAISARFADRLDGHRLRREIIVNAIVNDMVDHQGTTFAYRLTEGTGAGAAEIARAYTVARDVFDIRGIWAAIEALDIVVPAGIQTVMLLEARTLVERAARWLLRQRRPPIDVAAEVERFSAGAESMATALPGLLASSDRERFRGQAEHMEEAGVPEGLAHRVAGLDPLFGSLDITEVSADEGVPVEEVAAVYYALGERLDLHWLRTQINSLPRDNRWQTLARAALRDDLYSQQRAITAQVLRVGDGAMGPTERIDAWLGHAEAAARRVFQVVADIKGGAAADLASLSVALRESHRLIG
jgi:glutamate dehydrogenase